MRFASIILVVLTVALFVTSPSMARAEENGEFVKPLEGEEFEKSSAVEFEVNGPPNGEFTITVRPPGGAVDVILFSEVTLDAQGNWSSQHAFGNLGEWILHLREGTKVRPERLSTRSR